MADVYVRHRVDGRNLARRRGYDKQNPDSLGRKKQKARLHDSRMKGTLGCVRICVKKRNPAQKVGKERG